MEESTGRPLNRLREIIFEMAEEKQWKIESACGKLALGDPFDKRAAKMAVQSTTLFSIA